MTALWLRLGLAVDAGERLRGWARVAAGAALWTLFALVMAAAWLAPGIVFDRLLRQAF